MLMLIIWVNCGRVEISVALVQHDHEDVLIARTSSDRGYFGGMERGENEEEQEAKDTIKPCRCTSRRSLADLINEIIANVQLPRFTIHLAIYRKWFLATTRDMLLSFRFVPAATRRVGRSVSSCANYTR